MICTATPVVGVPDSYHWPQVFFHKIDEHRVFLSAFCFFDSHPRRVEGHAFIERLNKLPFGNVASLASSFERVVKGVEQNAVLSLAAVLVDGETAYFWTLNEGAVLLKRGEKKGVVVQRQRWTIVSGPIHEQDTVIVATKGFLEAVPHPFAIGESAEEIADNAVMSVQQAPSFARASAYIAQFGQTHQKPEDEVEKNREEVLTESSSKNDTLSREKIDATDQTISPEHQNDPLAPAAPTRIDIQPHQSKSPVFLVASMIRFVLRHIRSLMQMLRTRSQTVSIESSEQRKKRKTIVIGLLVVALIGITIFVWSSIRANEREKVVSGIVSPLRQQLSVAKEKESTDLLAARETARLVAERAEQEARQFPEKSVEARSISQFAQEARAYSNQISGEQSLDTLPVFYNFHLVRSGFLAKSSAIEGTTGVFLDAVGSAVQLDLETKQVSVPNLTPVTSAQDIAIRNKILYVLGDDVTGTMGVFSGGKRLGNATGQLLQSFGSSLYVYDKSAGEYYKYSIGSDSLGNETKWLRSSQGLDRSTVHSIAIDGSVWMGTTKGEIFTFAQGTKTAFSLKGLRDAFSTSLFLFTSEEHEFVYVLEPEKQRLVILGKDGVFKKQIVSKDIAAASDILVSADSKTAYLTAGSVVYSINLE